MLRGTSKLGDTSSSSIKRAASTPVPACRWIRHEADLDAALEALRELDPQAIGRMIAVTGRPPLRARAANLAGLVWIVVSQQVSTASARAIHARVQDRFGEVSHGQLLAASEEDLRSCGLSAPKMRTLRNIAAAIDAGQLDLPGLAALDAETARWQLTDIKGIGPWTADIYLLFCLGHPDVWPAGDLALQEGVRLALGLKSRPDPARLEKLSARWRPWRAAAARLVWAYYSHMLEMKRKKA